MVNNRLKSASLFESMVAMVVMAVVFSISLFSYLQLTQSSITGQKLKSIFIVREIAYQSQINKRFIDEVVERNGIRVEKYVSSYKGNKNLLMMRIEAYNPENLLLTTRKDIILLDEK